MKLKNFTLTCLSVAILILAAATFASAQQEPEQNTDPIEQLRLTPDQRNAARERYKSLKSLPPDKKSEMRQRWQEYQSMTPEQRRELATKPPSRPGGARAPAPASRPPAPAPSPPAPAPAGQ